MPITIELKVPKRKSQASEMKLSGLYVKEGEKVEAGRPVAAFDIEGKSVEIISNFPFIVKRVVPNVGDFMLEEMVLMTGSSSGDLIPYGRPTLIWRD